MQQQERPVLIIQKNKWDWLLDSITLACLFFIWGYSFLNYCALPDQIPVHFNELGFPNGYGSKDSIWLIPFIVSVVVIAFFILNKFPHRFNYLVNITAENALKQYKLSTRLLRIISLNIAILFSYIIYKEIQGATTGYSKLDWWFIPLLISSIITPTVWAMISMSKK
jgi:uncharacterized membrane protein